MRDKKSISFERLKRLSPEKRDLAENLFHDLNIFFHHLALSIMKHKSNAEDAVFISFEKIIINIDKISAIEKEERRPYCVVILKNVCSDLLKRKYIELSFEDTIVIEGHEEFVVQENLIDQIESEKLFVAINKLSDIEKEILSLRFFDNMSYSEIGEIMNISEALARKRKERIIKKLRLYMEE